MGDIKVKHPINRQAKDQLKMREAESKRRMKAGQNRQNTQSNV